MLAAPALAPELAPAKAPLGPESSVAVAAGTTAGALRTSSMHVSIRLTARGRLQGGEDSKHNQFMLQ